MQKQHLLCQLVFILRALAPSQHNVQRCRSLQGWRLPAARCPPAPDLKAVCLEISHDTSLCSEIVPRSTKKAKKPWLVLFSVKEQDGRHLSYFLFHLYL